MHRMKNMKASLETTLNLDSNTGFHNVLRCLFKKLAPTKHRALIHDRRQIQIFLIFLIFERHFTRIFLW